MVDAATGDAVVEYAYDPYGKPISESLTHSRNNELTNFPFSCPFRFQSKYYDAETGLYYFGYRYYDPASCKWLCRDPLQEQGGINLTAYCNNDPVNKVDPLGLLDLPSHGNITITAMREVKTKLGLTDSQYNDLLRGALEGSSYPDTQTRVPLPPGCVIPFLQDARGFFKYIGYPVDQVKKGLKHVGEKISKLKIDAISAVWDDYPRINKGVMNWWNHGPSCLGPVLSWGAKHNQKADSLNQTHYGALSWQHGMGDNTISAVDLQTKMISGSIENMQKFSVYVNNGNYYDAGFELGKTMHYLQDTYTPSHAQRDAKTGQITDFYDYVLQSPTLHAGQDKPKPGSAVYNTALKNSQDLIMMFLNGSPEDMSGFFLLAPKVSIGDAGDFISTEEQIGPKDLRKEIENILRSF